MMLSPPLMVRTHASRSDQKYPFRLQNIGISEFTRAVVYGSRTPARRPGLRVDGNQFFAEVVGFEVAIFAPRPYTVVCLV